MQDELFSVPPSLSPYAAFLEQHAIGTGETFDGRCAAFLEADESQEASADSQKEAVLALAQKLNLDGWQSINWD